MYQYESRILKNDFAQRTQSVTQSHRVLSEINRPRSNTSNINELEKNYIDRRTNFETTERERLFENRSTGKTSYNSNITLNDPFKRLGNELLGRPQPTNDVHKFNRKTYGDLYGERTRTTQGIYSDWKQVEPEPEVRTRQVPAERQPIPIDSEDNYRDLEAASELPEATGAIGERSFDKVAGVVPQLTNVVRDGLNIWTASEYADAVNARDIVGSGTKTIRTSADDQRAKEIAADKEAASANRTSAYIGLGLDVLSLLPLLLL